MARRFHRVREWGAMDWKAAGLVAIGGAVGAFARFAVSSAAPSTAFPWPTLLVNLLGAFLLGAFFLDPADGPGRALLAIGFLGAFTTLSTYSVETIQLWRAGDAGLAVLNMVANGLGGPLFALAGWRIALLTA